MFLLTDYYFTNILASFLTILIAFVTYYKWTHRYWKNRNVFVAKDTFPFGSPENPFTSRLHPGIQVKAVYDILRRHGQKHSGMYNFTIPLYIAADPKIIKNLLQKDFQHFADRGFYYNEKDDPLSANLFALGGDKWQILRTKLSSAFTPGKIKMMCDIIVDCGYQMQKALVSYCENGQPIDIKDISDCYTVDVIGSYAFGIECNSFKNPDAEFRKYAKTIFASVTPFHLITVYFAVSFPKIGRFLGIKLFKKETTDFFLKVVNDTVKFRETNNFVRNDILQLLIELRNQLGNSETEKNKEFTITELAAQVFVFFAAGFETSATTMTFCLYELATNPEIQQKVRDEIGTVLEKYQGKFTFESIADMKYMSQVVDETLRKYPPLPVLARRCVKDYKIPDTDVVIEKGMHCVVSVLGLHHDPSYYPDPERFDPERFSVENKQKIIPFTYIPFGEGPRICIGLRLGQLQTKVGLAVLLKHYKFSLNEKTVLPIQMNPRSFTMVPENEIFFNIEKVDN